MNINEITWNEKQSPTFGMNAKTTDVTVKIRGKSGHYLLVFYFRNNCLDFVQNAKTMLTSSVVNNRIYFMPDSGFGYTVHRPTGKNKTSYSILFRITDEVARKMINVWEKEFFINLDEECGLYYIENS